MVAVGRNNAASWPSSSAIRRCSSLTDGSSRYCSSPTSAAAIAANISGEGFVSVSERRSITLGRYRKPVDLTLLESTLKALDAPPYRARQVWEWTARGASGYDAMSNVPARLRAALGADVPFSTLTVESELQA